MSNKENTSKKVFEEYEVLRMLNTKLSTLFKEEGIEVEDDFIKCIAANIQGDCFEVIWEHCHSEIDKLEEQWAAAIKKLEPKEAELEKLIKELKKDE